MMENFSKYSAYTPEELLNEAQFRKWMREPSEELDSYWEAAFEQEPQLRAVAAEARQIWQDLAKTMDPHRLKHRPLDEAFIQTLRTNVSQSTRVRSLRRRQWMVAASAVLLLGFGYWWLTLRPSYVQEQTGFGEWKTLSLADGSSVQLNANSSLRYTSDWKTGQDREVWLEGEAYFEVAKDPKGASFTVHVGEMDVEVLGTAFNVNRREAETEVYLQEGKVLLDMGKAQKLMAPGDLAVFSEPQQELTTFRKAQAEAHISWKDGSLVLRNTPVSEIFSRMEEIYGYRFMVEDSTLLEVKKTVALPMNKLEMALPMLGYVLGLEFNIDEKQKIIHME